MRFEHRYRDPVLVGLLACLAGCGGLSQSNPVQANASISITLERRLFFPGDTAQITATVRDSADQPVQGLTIAWSADDSTIVTVSESGLLTAHGPGSTVITASAEDQSESIGITVADSGTAPVVVEVGQDIQALVNEHADGTVFLIKAGVHRRQSIVPKSGMSFIGEPGAVLTGEDQTDYAFNANVPPYPRNVTIRGLIIEHYAPPVQYGAIRADVSMGAWTIEDCEIRYNATGGIRLGPRMRVLRNRIHHNGQIGVLGGGDDILIEGNEIYFNNPEAKYDMYWEAGGTKFTRTRDLVVRDNFVHHNHGPGLWTDIDNVRTLFEGNRVEDNAEAGIFHEISYAAVIRNNQTRRNGTHAVPADWITGSGILISSSSDVEVYGNIVEDNHNGITGIQRDRGAGAHGVYDLRNLYVHDNTVRMSSGVTGIATGGIAGLFDRDTYTSGNNRFAGNSYDLGENRTPFQWRGKRRTWEEWRGFGQDSSGKRIP